ncbi:MAG TPA: peptidylprolyl isomerase, partial [Acidimicrobiales bacterium]|nr:peptidylprolyl isomerase [Acidimicrobiales bacterium]
MVRPPPRASTIGSVRAIAAPGTVNNFVFLARWHYYDGIVFHRIIPGFML